MYTHFMRGDWERAIETDTDDLKWVTNACLSLIGRKDEAVANYHRISQQRLPRMMVLMTTAAWQALEGRRAEAVQTIREFSVRPFDPEGVYLVARSLAFIGEHASALDRLAHIVEAGFFCPQILLRDPWLDPIRGERRFNTIVARARERSQDAEAEFRRLGGDQLLSLS
jgi:hypothetical protein